MDNSRKTSLLALVCLGLYFIMSVLLSFTGVESGVTLYALSALFVTVPAFLLPSIWFRRNALKTISEPPRCIPLLLCVLIGAGAFALNISLSSLMSAAFYNIEITSMAATTPYATDYISRVIVILSLAVIPAICEELFVRGALLEGWRGKGGIAAVFLSAAYFALLHIAPSNIPIYFIIGILLGFVYLVTRNVWLTIVIHFINNLITTLFSFTATATTASAFSAAALATAASAQETASAFTQADFVNVGLLYLAVACIFILPSIYALIRYCDKNAIGKYAKEQTPSIAVNKKIIFADPFLWIAFALLIMLNIFGGLIEFGVILQ